MVSRPVQVRLCSTGGLPMRPSAAHVSRPCSTRWALVLDVGPRAKRRETCSRKLDWSDEPEAVHLSPPAKRKEYRDHHWVAEVTHR